MSGLVSVVELLTVMQALKRFYDTVMQAVMRHVRFDGNRDLLHVFLGSIIKVLFSLLAVIKCLLVASPGFVKVSFIYTFEYVYTCVLLCANFRTSFVNIYLLRLSRVTIKLCWKINLSFFWYATLSYMLKT